MTERRGKWLIGGMLVTGLLLSGYAWWHQYQSGRRSAEYWGRTTAVLLRYAPQVEYIPLVPAGSGQPPVSIGGEPWGLGQPVDITKTRGLVHARHALVDDLSFQWGAAPQSPPQWRYLLRFNRDRESTMVAIAPDQGLVMGIDAAAPLAFIPKIAAAFQQKSAEWAARK